MTQKVAAAQIPSLKGDISTNIATHLVAIERAAQLGVSYIVFPELSLTGYELELASKLAFTLDDKRLQPLIDSAMKHNINIGVGVPLLGEEGMHIALLLISPSGIIDSYAKIHLHSGEKKYFTQGTFHHIIEIDGIKIANAICADIADATHPRICAKLGAEVYMAGVLISKSGYEEDAVLLKDYSQEHTMLVTMANHNQSTGGWQPAGRSAVWFRGRLLASANETENALVIAEKQDKVWTGRIVAL